MAKRQTRSQINNSIERIKERIKRDPNDLQALREGAQLIGFDVEPASDGTHHYRGGVYTEYSVLVEELLIDLGVEQRRLLPAWRME